MLSLKFETLITDHASSMKMYALHFTHDEQDADDLVQDTVLKAITYREKFQEGTNIKGWLYTIMKNTFINNYRRVMKTSGVITQSEEITPANLFLSATENRGEKQFVMDDIKDAMNKLSEDYYVPFTMYFEGYKYQEIADHLRIPIGTIKTRIHVARRLLKKSLKTYSFVKSTSALSHVSL